MDHGRILLNSFATFPLIRRVSMSNHNCFLPSLMFAFWNGSFDQVALWSKKVKQPPVVEEKLGFVMCRWIICGGIFKKKLWGPKSLYDPCPTHCLPGSGSTFPVSLLNWLCTPTLPTPQSPPLTSSSHIGRAHLAFILWGCQHEHCKHPKTKQKERPALPPVSSIFFLLWTICFLKTHPYSGFWLW